jgi:hypothetical protein
VAQRFRLRASLPPTTAAFAEVVSPARKAPADHRSLGGGGQPCAQGFGGPTTAVAEVVSPRPGGSLLAEAARVTLNEPRILRADAREAA